MLWKLIPPDWWEAASWSRRLRVCLNDDRRPNRSPDPILITDADGISHRIYIFTYEGDPLAESWTLLDAFPLFIVVLSIAGRAGFFDTPVYDGRARLQEWIRTTWAELCQTRDWCLGCL